MVRPAVRVGRFFAGLFARKHPEEVAGVREVVARLDRLLAFTDALVCGNDAGDLRRSAGPQHESPPSCEGSDRENTMDPISRRTMLET